MDDEDEREPMTTASQNEKVARRGTWVLLGEVAFLVALTVLLLHRRPGEDSFWFSDAARHAMDGVFLLDIVRDGGGLHPYGYALAYMARYPALGLAYYPPFFALVEAGFYGVAGVGLGTARAAVVFFGLLAVLGLYALGRRARSHGFGLAAAVAFITMPEVARWGREVMLELPTAGMLVVVGLFLHLWADEGKRWAGYACAAALLASVLTKQTAAFMFLVVPLYLVATRRARLLWSREALVASAVVLLVLLPYAVFCLRFYAGAVAHGAARASKVARFLSLRTWGHGLHFLPGMSSWPVVALAGVGLVACFVRRGERLGRFLAIWAVVGYLFAMYLTAWQPRYLYFVLPAVACLAVCGACAVLPVRVARVPLRALAVAAVLAYQAWLGVSLDLPSVSDGYARAAAIVASAPRGETALFDGFHAGNFVYHVRAADRARRCIVLRSDKIFGRVSRYDRSAPPFALEVKGVEEVREVLRAHGVGHVVLEPGEASLAVGLRPLLAAAVSAAPWVLRARVPVSTHGGARHICGDILVYENPQAGPATAEAIPLWAPLSQRQFRVSYEAVRRGWSGPWNEGVTNGSR